MMKRKRYSTEQIVAALKQVDLGLVCSLQSGPGFELVPASDMELRHGQESQARRDYREAA